MVLELPVSLFVSDGIGIAEARKINIGHSVGSQLQSASTVRWQSKRCSLRTAKVSTRSRSRMTLTIVTIGCHCAASGHDQVFLPGKKKDRAT